MGYDERIQRLEQRHRDSAGLYTAPEVSFAETLRQRMHARADGEDVPVDEREAKFYYTVDEQILNKSGLGFELLCHLSRHVEYGQPPKSDEVVQATIDAQTKAASRRLNRCASLPPSGWARVYEEEGPPGSGL